MSCTPFIYVSNSGVSGIATDGIVPLGSVVRTHTTCDGPNCKLDGTGIICKGNNQAFFVSGHITLAPSDTSSEDAVMVSVAVNQNGSISQGSEVTEDTTGTITLPIGCVVRNDCCSSSVITLVNTGVGVDISNLALTVIPI